MLSPKTIDKAIAGAQHFVAYVLKQYEILIFAEELGDFTFAGLDHIVEAVAASSESFLEEVDLSDIAFLLFKRHHPI